MEPFSYHISLLYTWIGWLYFFFTRGRSEFELGSFKEYHTQRAKEARLAEAGFDVDRHEQLTRLRDRYKRSLAAHASAVAGA